MECIGAHAASARKPLFRLRRWIVTGLCLAVPSAGDGTACAAQGPPSAVALPSWTPPIALEGIPANRLIRWPILATFRDTVYVASNLYPIEGTSVGDRPIYLSRLSGGVISAPAGSFQFVYPKIVAAPNGEIHLVWAEFDSTRHDVIDWPGGLQTTLWHSVFTHASWSTPEEIFRATALSWTKDDGHLAIDRSGALHAVVWAIRGQNTGVAHLHRDAAGWRAEHIPYASLHDATALHVSGDSVVIAFVGDSFEPSDTTGVTVLLSTDSGATWSKPVVVRRLGGRTAVHPQFIRTEERLLLVWGESAPRKFGLDTLRVVRLSESLQPVPVALVPLPPGSSTFSVASTPCGDLSVLVGTLALSPRTFEVTVDSRGVVAQRSLFPDDQVATFSGAGATFAGFVAVFAVRPHPGTPAHMVLMTRPACRTKR